MATVTQKKLPVAEVSSWSLRRRIVVSLLLLFHVTAVFAPPFSFETSPVPGMGSPFAESIMRALQPYIDAAYLNHGYAFFAPDPGPSHLLRAKIEFPDGRVVEETLPDLEEHWPRLLYHRHFMLAEHLHGAFTPPQPPPEIADDPQQREYWQFGRNLYEARRDAMENHLRGKHPGAGRITLTRIEHRQLDPPEIWDLDKSITDPDTYRELTEYGQVDRQMEEIAP